ncbi:MAG: DUF1648 domain-containing protein [Clostridiales bacterium]|nr:DUF1648 domain-containing protein [Clostridiales bacterium]
MKKKISFSLVAGSIVCLLPLALSIVVYDRLPEYVPIHWGYSGIPDNFAPKSFAAYGLPFLFLILFFVINLFLQNDPKRANMPKILRIPTCWTVPLLSLITIPMALFIALGVQIPIVYILQLVTSLIILIMGNYLPKCKPNYTLGIRLPWTLYSEDNWNKTHRFAGYVWSILGLILLLMNLFSFYSYSFLIYLLLVLLPGIYSFLYFKKNNKENPL